MIDRACISLNNNCNLRCRYCHFQDKQHDFTSFGATQLIKIVDNIHAYCVDNNLSAFKLGIVGSGEPMIKKVEMAALLTHIKARGYSELKLYTITNGTLLSKKDLTFFHFHKDIISLCFSLDGYEEIHNYGRDKFGAVMQRIDWYKEIFGVSPSINATVNLLSYQYKEKLVEFFKGNGLNNVTFSKLVGYCNDDLYITDEQYSDFMEYIRVSGLNSRQFSDEKKYDCTMYGRLCGVGRTNIFITPEGVYPCGRFYKDERYLLGSYDAALYEIEMKVKLMKPVADGKCYYIENVEVRR